MFFILSKLSYFFISPFSWLLVAFLLFILLKNKRWKKRMKYTTLVIFFFFSNTFLFKEAIRIWEVPAKSSFELKTHEVGIVLGGMFSYDNDTERLSIRRGGDRIWQAIDLYKRRKIAKFLLSGDNGHVVDKGLHESQQLKELLVRWGIPSKDIIVEGRSKNTAQNAQNTTDLLNQSYPHLSSFLLITSAQHMKRAKACFDKAGIETTMFSTDPYVGPKRDYSWEEFIIPSVDNFLHWSALNKEILGYVVYDIMGYI
jgi:uncharacterized SAM-binding protein YcdF (DUF218 family)